MKKYYSLGMLLLLCSVAIVTADPILQQNSGHQKSDGVLLFSSPDEQFTVQGLEEIRTGIITNFIQKYGKPNHPIVTSSIDVPEGTIVAAYGFKIFTGGVTCEYLGIASNPELAPLVHKNAYQWDVETEAKGGAQILGTWDWISSGARYWVDCPKGAVTNNYELRKCVNDNSSTYDWYIIHQTYQIIPGILECGSTYKNETGWAIQNWGVCSLSPYLVDWDPQGTLYGSQDVTVTLSAATSGCPEHSWEFHLGSGTILTGTADSANSKAKWKMEFTTEDARTHTRRMEPGSLCRINQPSTPGTYKLVAVTSQGIFKNSNNTMGTVEYTLTLWVTY